MSESLFARVKAFLVSVLPVSGDALQVFVGIGCYLATCIIFKQPLTSGWALLPGILIAFSVEGIEIWEHYGTSGLSEIDTPQVVEVIVRHFRDVIVMNLSPIAVLLTARLVERLTG